VAGVEDVAPRTVILGVTRRRARATLAAALQRALGPGTGYVGQDHFRRIVLREHGVPHGHSIDFIANAVWYRLRIGFHVILEEILVSDHYGQMLREWSSRTVGAATCSTSDVPLDETLLRHDGRALRATVPQEKLQDWFVPSDLSGVAGRSCSTAPGGTEATAAVMIARLGPLSGQHDGAEEQFCRFFRFPLWARVLGTGSVRLRL
jgi:hypothetical protein